MWIYEIDPTRTVGATERTRDAGRTDGRTDGWSETNVIPPYNGYNDDDINNDKNNNDNNDNNNNNNNNDYNSLYHNREEFSNYLSYDHFCLYTYYTIYIFFPLKWPFQYWVLWTTYSIDLVLALLMGNL